MKLDRNRWVPLCRHAHRPLLLLRAYRSHLLFVCIVVVSNLVVYWRPGGIGAKDKVTIQEADAFLREPAEPHLWRSSLPPPSDFSGHFDPRLAPALAINTIAEHLQHHGPTAWEKELSVPFSWSSWVDLTSAERLVYEQNRSWMKLDKHSGVARVVCPTEEALSSETRRHVGANYLQNSAPVPLRLVVLGSGLEKDTIVVPLHDGHGSDISAMTDRFTHRYPGSTYTELQQEVQHLSHHLNQLDLTPSARPGDASITQEVLRIAANTLEPIERSDFLFDKTAYTDSIVQRSVELHDVFEARLAAALDTDVGRKYFHEAVIHKDKRGYHYDWRFFDTVDYTDYERKAILHRISRAWLRFANSVGIQTWLAHGTLLGWYWNGMCLPWDSDLDVQTTTSSLLLLARNYNQSVVLDVTDNDISSGVSSYFIDVSPNFHSRERGNGMNTIDARFIDTSTGFYVDITALSFNTAAVEESMSHKEMGEFNQVLDPDYLAKKNSHTVSGRDLKAELDSLRSNLINTKELYNCKNLHFNSWTDLSPLKQTLYEGVKAFVPRNFQSILKREYHHGLFSKQHEKHTYRPMLDLWVPSHVCKRDDLGNACSDTDTLLDAKQTKPFSAYHRSEMERKKMFHEDFEPFRVDPWVVRHAKWVANNKSS